MNNRLILLLIPLTTFLAAALVVLLFAKPATPKVVELYAGPEGSTCLALRQNAHNLRERMEIWHEDHPDSFGETAVKDN